MTEKEKTQLLNRIKLIENKIDSLERGVLLEKQRRLMPTLKKYWDRTFSTLYSLLASTQSGTTLLQRMVMFLETIYRWVRSGFKLEDELSQIARMEMCKACPEFKKDTTQCKVCGCLMSSKVKIASASCPLNKW